MRHVPRVSGLLAAVLCLVPCLNAETPPEAGTRSAVVRVVDNGDPGFTVTGKWVQANAARVYGKDILYNSAPAGAAETATWTFLELPAGKYRISVSWEWRSNLATSARYTVSDGERDLISTVVNQRAGAKSFVLERVAWADLGNVDVRSGTLKVALDSSAADGPVFADAIRIERFEGDTPPPPSPVSTPVQTPAPVATQSTPQPAHDPVPLPEGMEAAPERAIRVTNVRELVAALRTVKDYATYTGTAHGQYNPDKEGVNRNRIICMAAGVYDLAEVCGGRSLQLTNEWLGYYHEGDNLTLLGGFDPTTWTRPAETPPVMESFSYDPQTGEVVLPERLRTLLSGETLSQETILCNSHPNATTTVTTKNARFVGRLDRVVIMGTRSFSPHVDQPTPLDLYHPSAHFKDVVLIPRYGNGHSYIGCRIWSGTGMLWEKGIVYFPFTGSVGNCRPQAIWSVEFPERDEFTARDSLWLAPVNGGYIRLPNFYGGGRQAFEKCGFLAANPGSYTSSAHGKNIWQLDESGHAKWDFHQRFRQCLFVLGKMNGGVWRTPELTIIDSDWYCRDPYPAEGAIWTERLTLDDVRFHLEQGEPLPTGERMTQLNGGTWQYITGSPDEALNNNFSLVPPAEGTPATIKTTTTHQPWHAPDYLRIVTPDMIGAAFAEHGEAASGILFDTEYPAMKVIP